MKKSEETFFSELCSTVLKTRVEGQKGMVNQGEMAVKCNVHNPKRLMGLPTDLVSNPIWLRGVDLNHRPLGYEPNELPDCSTPQFDHSNQLGCRQTWPEQPVRGALVPVFEMKVARTVASD
jgi:hypothetical protein